MASADFPIPPAPVMAAILTGRSSSRPASQASGEPADLLGPPGELRDVRRQLRRAGCALGRASLAGLIAGRAALARRAHQGRSLACSDSPSASVSSRTERR